MRRRSQELEEIEDEAVDLKTKNQQMAQAAERNENQIQTESEERKKLQQELARITSEWEKTQTKLKDHEADSKTTKQQLGRP